MLKFLTSAALLFGAFAAQAADDPTQTITDALHKVAPQATIQSIAESTVPGFYSVVTDGHVILMSGDGKYLIEGHVYDINARVDMMQEGMTEARKVGLAKIPKDKKLIFAPPNPKYTVTVFTDVDCPFCRQFHKQIAEYNKLGIAVEYVLYPLSIHPGSDKKAQTVWCEKDRNSAYTNAMNGQSLPPKTCSNPIAETGNIAATMGISGTPAIITSDGAQLGGYVAPDQLLQELQNLQKKKPATAQ
ncbi:MAG TPA: DsbC family protein [Rudaea sp.]|jgi:thiol:disulfide interchange protein DsbC|nr:DsbC family protein [Rudaea sp.]